MSMVMGYGSLEITIWVFMSTNNIKTNKWEESKKAKKNILSRKHERDIYFVLSLFRLPYSSSRSYEVFSRFVFIVSKIHN